MGRAAWIQQPTGQLSPREQREMAGARASTHTRAHTQTPIYIFYIYMLSATRATKI